MLMNVVIIVAQVWISLGLGLWLFRVLASPPTTWRSYLEPGWCEVLFVFPFLAMVLAPLLVFAFVRNMAHGHG